MIFFFFLREKQIKTTTRKNKTKQNKLQTTLLLSLYHTNELKKIYVYISILITFFTTKIKLK